ncbi:hypothetical protein [Clostridium sp.]|uniref:hypothetical protein n=1 Tax=Clostridium sp. TaxID=1506 RepID=UPI002638E5D9|nr:hypothetical protein [Clostridium sp.]
MKRYLNKSLFYQGDSKIILPLLLLYLSSVLVNNSIINSYFESNIIRSLYSTHYYNGYLINTFLGIAFLILYLCIAYIISVGIFKRKKWTTLLSGPFSRIDIRKREFYIISFSALIYLITFIGLLIQKTYIYYEIVKYVDYFNVKALLDILKIISISTIVIGGLALLDSFFANLYYMVASIIFIFVYIIGILINYNSIIVYYVNSPYNVISGTRNIQNYIEGYYDVYEGYIGITTEISMFFIIVGLICLFIGKKLTNKMLVENMNEGVIFNFPKRILEFMIITFPGIILSPAIVGFISERYFNYNLDEKNKIIFIIGSIVILSLISYIVLIKVKKSFKNKKDRYYKI